MLKRKIEKSLPNGRIPSISVLDFAKKLYTCCVFENI